MAEGKIRPAGQLRHRLPTSQAMIWFRWAALKWRGRNWMAPAPADTTSPASAASSPAPSSRRTPRRLPRRVRVSAPAAGDQATVPFEDGPGCAPARRGDHGGTAGGPPDSGLPSPSSSRIVTTEIVRPVRAIWPTGAGLATPPEAAAGTGYSSVGGQRGIDLADPGEHATAHMDRVGETRVLHHGEGLGGALPALAVQHDPLVLRQPLQRGAGQELALRDQHRAGDGDDLVLVGLPDVHQEDFIVSIEHGLELGGRDGGVRRGPLSVLGDHAAELFVVDQLGNRWVLPADRALGVLAHVDRAERHV